ncbi:hypothetical protein TKWG_25729 (plasmid) [Advenella kashmirensis WT001]|uniref:PIN domain-containing protein n=2 Tax=Advenella TaxID=290425 RepID=I3UI13_ADVKW|nr:hypothetical protein [Advenella kashmirensis]AFK64651.1 hypothetical protein TKWG_25729 [Advenella kashmirensis WT001]
MAKTVLVDTCYWIGLFDERDPLHNSALKLEPQLRPHTLLLPWPTLYEFVNTRFTKNKKGAALEHFRKYVEGGKAQLVCDLPYRNNSLQIVFDNRRGHYSLTDVILRSLMEDVNVPINALVTSNDNDFHDVRAKRNIELLVI